MAVRRTAICLGILLNLALGLLLIEPARAQDDLEREQAERARITAEIERIRGEVSRIRQRFENELAALEEKLKTLEARLADLATDATEPQRAGQTGEPGASAASAPDIAATVCRRGCPFSDLNKAIRAADPGGTVAVAPGPLRTCAVILKPIRLVGLKDRSGNRAHLTGFSCEGKGSLVVRAPDVVIEGFEISDIAVPDENGACVRIDPKAGDVTIRDLYCHDSETGLLGGPRSGSLLIENSIFERNGRERARGHGLYISRGDQFILRNSQVLSTKGLGHSLKTGAKRTVIEGSVIAALDGANSRAIDAFSGGELVIRYSVIHQGENSDNNEAFGIALERNRLNPKPHSTTLEDSWIIFDGPAHRRRLLLRARQYGPFTLRRNRFVAMTELTSSSMDIENADNQFYSDRKSAGLPAYDGTPSSLPMPGASE